LTSIDLTIEGTTYTIPPVSVVSFANGITAIGSSCDASGCSLPSGANNFAFDWDSDGTPGLFSYATSSTSGFFVSGGSLRFEFTPLAATPLPAALPLFASGIGALSLFGWRRKRKNAAVVAAA